MTQVTSLEQTKPGLKPTVWPESLDTPTAPNVSPGRVGAGSRGDIGVMFENPINELARRHGRHLTKPP